MQLSASRRGIPIGNEGIAWPGPLLPKLKKQLGTLEEQFNIRKVVDPMAWVHLLIVIALKKEVYEFV